MTAQLTMKSTETWVVYLDRAEKLIEQDRVLRVTAEDKEVVIARLRGLSERYNNIGYAI